MIYLLNSTFCIAPKNFNCNPEASTTKGFTLIIDEENYLKVLPATYLTSDLKHRVDGMTFGKYKTRDNVGKIFFSRYTHKIGLILSYNAYDAEVYVFEARSLYEVGYSQRIVQAAIEFAPDGFEYTYDSARVPTR